MGVQETVVLTHGIYLHGVAMLPLARHLRRQGFHTVVYSYHSLRQTPAESARTLKTLVDRLDSAAVHYLAHSLGGLVIRHLMARFHECLPAGRTVTLGTPHQPSLTARGLKRRRFGFILGRSVEQGLLGDAPPWPPGRELGSIAGTLDVGIGQVLAGGLPKPSDGTVAVIETRIEGMNDHICLPVNHTSMLFSTACAIQAEAFFRSGCFRHELAGKC